MPAIANTKIVNLKRLGQQTEAKWRRLQIVAMKLFNIYKSVRALD
jgi:hypothetical protein